MADIQLSSNEDSVTSLAISQSTASSGTALAGINSSTEEQNAGRNEHLRSFELRYPPRRKTAPHASETLNEQALESKDATKALRRASLFTPSTAAKKETYQRTLRLSRPKKEEKERLGAVATGLAPEGEIVAFDASVESPTAEHVLRRIRLGQNVEAADVDITDSQDSDFHLAYCTDYEVFIAKISRTDIKTPEPASVYGTTNTANLASTSARPRFRSLRFIAQNLLLLLQNKPNRSGVELLLLELPSPPSLGHIIFRKRLNRSVQSATALSTSLLPPSCPSGTAQTVIAVAGQDNSISIFTLDHQSQPPFSSPKFRNHAHLRNVHGLQITSLTLSIFHLPSDLSTASPQYLKLASTSIASTVVVHSLPLTPYPLPTAKQRPSRYVLTRPGRSEATQMTFSVLISAIVIAIGAFLLQAFTEIRGGTPEYLGAKGWLSNRVHGWIARPYMFEDVTEKLGVPGVETEPMKGIQSQLEELKDGVKAALHQPKVVEVPGVETKSSAGTKSQATGIRNGVQDEDRQPGEEAVPAAENAADGVKGQVWEGLEGLKQQHEKIEEGAANAAKGAKKGAEHARQSVADATHRAKNSIASAQSKLGLRDLLSRRASLDHENASDQGPSDIIVRHDEDKSSLSADTRDADTVIGETHKRWEELEQHERETWKRRLIDAGEWAVEEGEAVFKGVFFQSIKLAVGAAVEAAL